MDGWMDEGMHMDGGTNGQMEGQTDKQTDRWMDGYSCIN